MIAPGAASAIVEAPHRRAADAPVSAVIDIGSNSIRLVAFRGERRTPLPLFNEKVMAGLGTGVAETGAMSKASLELAHSALDRFALLCADMGAANVQAFATAAVRDADNGEAFAAEARARTGIDIRILSGEEEAHYSAYGVIAGIPDADGVVGDLGGGSLELVRVRGGEPLSSMSLPIGSLRLAEARKEGPRHMQRVVAKALSKVGWAGEGEGLPFYMVGGSWRALAQLHMHLTDHPLPVIHHYEMPASATERLARALPNLGAKRLKGVPRLSKSRIPHLPGAALLLRAVVKRLGCSKIIASAYGVREGVFYRNLRPVIRYCDPLISAAQEEGGAQSRFPQHGEALMRWMDGLFQGEKRADKRLRLVAAELSDVAWRAHPDFRAERGLEVALHGNWVGIDARERAMLGWALFTLYGGSLSDPLRGQLAKLAEADALHRAAAWGLALRLGHRLTAGTAETLASSSLSREGDAVVLTLASSDRHLYAEAVERRLDALAKLMDLRPKFRISG